MPLATIAPDAPFFIVLNAGSGHDDARATREIIEAVLTAAKREYELHLVDEPSQLHAVAADTVKQAQARGGVVVVAGGDGTINAVAHATYGSGCALGVLPQGTFNYFSRVHGIPADTQASTTLLLSARAQPVQVGLVNGKVFLVNASLGLYPQLLEEREASKRRFGRSRPVAMVSGLVTLMRSHRQLQLRIEHAGRTEARRTPTLFVGNNALQFDQIGIPEGAAVEDGSLVAIVLRPVGTWAMLWLLARGALGTLGDADNIDSFAFQRIAVDTTARGRPGRVKVATDGEIVWMETPVEFSVGTEPLYLLKPEPEKPEPEPAAEARSS